MAQVKLPVQMKSHPARDEITTNQSHACVPKTETRNRDG